MVSAKVLLATNNAKKMAEMRRIFNNAGLSVDVITLADAAAYPEPVEDEWTFEGNALLKAKAGVSNTGLPTLADDSGISVAALNQMPGVRSSRWAGPDSDDQANLELLLRQLSDIPEGRRQATFVCAMALALPDGREFTVRGEMPGCLAFAPLGKNGFGYDPIFIADEQEGDQGLTNGQLSASAKDAISHRGKAIRAILPIIAEHVEGAK